MRHFAAQTEFCKLLGAAQDQSRYFDGRVFLISHYYADTVPGPIRWLNHLVQKPPFNLLDLGVNHRPAHQALDRDDRVRRRHRPVVQRNISNQNFRRAPGVIPALLALPLL